MNRSKLIRVTCITRVKIMGQQPNNKSCRRLDFWELKILSNWLRHEAFPRQSCKCEPLTFNSKIIWIYLPPYSLKYIAFCKYSSRCLKACNCSNLSSLTRCSCTIAISRRRYDSSGSPEIDVATGVGILISMMLASGVVADSPTRMLLARRNPYDCVVRWGLLGSVTVICASKLPPSCSAPYSSILLILPGGAAKRAMGTGEFLSHGPANHSPGVSSSCFITFFLFTKSIVPFLLRFRLYGEHWKINQASIPINITLRTMPTASPVLVPVLGPPFGAITLPCDAVIGLSVASVGFGPLDVEGGVRLCGDARHGWVGRKPTASRKNILRT